MKNLFISILSSLFLLSSHKKLRQFFVNRDNSEIFSRILYDSDGTLFLVDSNGNQYESYSTAWRYLGMYLDCGDNDDNGGSGDYGVCYRKILWAAYVDPKYHGGSIGEYKFYNISSGEWDKSTCRTRRCRRMDCHEPNTHFKLLGVFKENDGLYDFAEQLFKHHGYCVWDDDGYDFMSGYRENWPTGCTDIYFYDYNNGGYQTVYWDMQPYSFGNFTYGLYEDDSCSTLSSQYNVSDLLRVYYNNYGYSSQRSTKLVSAFEYRQQRINEYMNEYKICQPCRAYSKYENYEDEDNGDSNDSGDNLDEGGGYAEQSGYNCYDDAGYRNCDQCYKFQTKTDMSEADTYDLATASEQGTMLEIKVNGKVYGSGGYRSEPEPSHMSSILTLAAALFSVCVIAFTWHKKSHIIKRKIMSNSLKEVFIGSDTSSGETPKLGKIKSKSKKSKRKVKRGNSNVDDLVVLRTRSKRDCHDILYNSDYVKQIRKHKSDNKESIGIESGDVPPALNSNENENHTSHNENLKEQSTHLPLEESNTLC